MIGVPGFGESAGGAGIVLVVIDEFAQHGSNPGGVLVGATGGAEGVFGGAARKSISMLRRAMVEAGEALPAAIQSFAVRGSRARISMVSPSLPASRRRGKTAASELPFASNCSM